jgi:RNA polymerase sigma-70 factor (ECF subfamily)
MEERKAIAQLQRGDIEGLEALVRTHYDAALRTAYLITHDQALAEDVVQASFLHAYEQIGQFDARRPFRPWFLRSVANSAVNVLTRRRRDVSWERVATMEGDVALTRPDPAPTPEERLTGAETQMEMWAALRQLSPEQRAVVVLRYYHGMDEAELSDALACPPGTVKSRLHAARRRLRALLHPSLRPASVLSKES